MSKKDTIQNPIIKLYKSTNLYNIDDVLYALKQKGLRGSINLSGHKVRNGEEYIELRNISFIANKDFIIDRDHIVGHRDVDPIVKPSCPGDKFPFDRFINDLKNIYNN